MGLNEDLCALTALTDAQLAGLDGLAAMTSRQQTAFVKKVEAAWDANQQGLRDAKEAALVAREAYTAACQAMSAISGRPGWRRRNLLDELTRVERVELADADDARVAAYEAVLTADEAVKAAQAAVKAGVLLEDK